MRIGVDIDGVLNYREMFVLEEGAKFCAETGKGRMVEPTAHSSSVVYGWDVETGNEFWKQRGIKQMYEWPARRFAAEVIGKLREMGHEIWIVTGRHNGEMLINGMPRDNWEDTTKLWLEENNIYYDGIVFGKGGEEPNDKGTFCAENGIELMIEDLPEYLEKMVGKTQVMIFDQPYNRGFELPGAERVYSWYDIYQKIVNKERW